MIATLKINLINTAIRSFLKAHVIMRKFDLAFDQYIYLLQIQKHKHYIIVILHTPYYRTLVVLRWSTFKKLCKLGIAISQCTEAFSFITF